MEFLMTYGWSVLIVTAVIVILFNMGIFNSANFAPKAQPGNCKVLRTGGFTNLEGTCSGVPPQSVAMFNGISGSILTGNLNGAPAITSSGGLVTLTGWAYSSDITTYRSLVTYGSTPPLIGLAYDDNCGSIPDVLSILYYLGGTYADYCLAPPITAGTWAFYAVTYNGVTGAAVTYEGAGGSLYSHTSTYSLGSNVIPANPPVSIGTGTGITWFGVISNIQVYNTTLDANQIGLLYREGIGGAPIAPQSIVGWWPLNGNANDYSGNNDNGAATGITYTSSWTSGYTAP